MSVHGQSLNGAVGMQAGTPHVSFRLASLRACARHAISALSFQRTITVGEAGLDFITSLVAVFSAYYFYDSAVAGGHLRQPTRELSFLAAVVGVLTVLLFERDSAYRGGTSLLRIRESERVLKIPCTAVALLLPLNWLAGQALSCGVILTLIVVLPLSLMIQKALFFSCVEALHARGYGIRRVLIYGAGHTGRRLFTALLNSPKLGYQPVAITDHDASLRGTQIFELGYNRRQSVYVDQGPITEERLCALRCDTLFIAVPDLGREAMFDLLQAATAARCEVAFLPDSRQLNAHGSELIDLDGLLLTFAGEVSVRWPYAFLKRVFDVTVSFCLLVLLSPLLMAIALIIRLDSDGEALFKQDRVGLNGRRFQIFKFRTMYTDSPKYATSPILPGDRRITRIGRVLRRTSLDELPQLINVCLGEMSLVGPRPEMPFLVEQYGPVERQRLRVMPGITGMWQLSADRAFHIHESPEYDLYYIHNRGFFLDFAILLHTALFAMRGI